MMLTVIGCSFRNAPVEVREHLAFDADALGRALDELNGRYGCEAVVLSTCNRVEVYLARPEADVGPDADLLAEFLGEFHHFPAGELRPYLYGYHHADARQAVALRRRGLGGHPERAPLA